MAHMAENLVKSNPKTYFNFPSCITCFQKPCERLRYGGVYPGKFIILHSHEYSFTNCQFAAASIDEVDQLLNNLQVHDIVYETGKVISFMSPAEQIHWNMDHFVTDYSDWAGYMEFIRRLWEERIIIVLRIPYFYQQDLKVRRWLHALEGGVELIHKVEKDDLSGKAATDALIDDGSPTNPEKPDNGDKDDEKKEDGTLYLLLDIDPNSAKATDTTYSLVSTDPQKTYQQTKTIKDDTDRNDDMLSFTFTNVKKDLSYSLEIDPGAGGDKYFYFENMDFQELSSND